GGHGTVPAGTGAGPGPPFGIGPVAAGVRTGEPGPRGELGPMGEPGPADEPKPSGGPGLRRGPDPRAASGIRLAAAWSQAEWPSAVGGGVSPWARACCLASFLSRREGLAGFPAGGWATSAAGAAVGRSGPLPVSSDLPRRLERAPSREPFAGAASGPAWGRSFPRPEADSSTPPSGLNQTS